MLVLTNLMKQRCISGNHVNSFKPAYYTKHAMYAEIIRIYDPQSNKNINK